MHLFKKPIVYVPVTLLLIVAAAGSYFLFFVTRDPIPQSIRSQVGFTLYYPKSLPAGWSIIKTSYYADTSDQVVGYTIQGPSGNLNLSIQPVPKSFNFNDFYTKRLSGTVQFLTPLGQAAIGKSGGQYVGSLETTSSWVLASSSAGAIPLTDIQFVLSHLQTTQP